MNVKVSVCFVFCCVFPFSQSLFFSPPCHSATQLAQFVYSVRLSYLCVFRYENKIISTTNLQKRTVLSPLTSPKRQTSFTDSVEKQQQRKQRKQKKKLNLKQ